MFYLKNIYLYFSIGNGQPKEPTLCQLYWHTFVPYMTTKLNKPMRMPVNTFTNQPVPTSFRGRLTRSSTMWCILVSSFILRVSCTSRACRSRHVAESTSGSSCVDVEAVAHWSNALSLAHLQTTKPMKQKKKALFNAITHPISQKFQAILIPSKNSSVYSLLTCTVILPSPICHMPAPQIQARCSTL